MYDIFNSVSRNLLLAVCCGLVLSLSTAGCSSSTSTTPEERVVRVSLQPIPTYAPLWIAKRKGWLQEALQEAGQGSVQWSTMRDGPLQNEAFAAGLIDVALTADTPAIIGRAAGLDIEVVALAATSPASLAILVPSDSPAKSMADLKGKKIAATKGSFCHHLLALALQRDGLSLSDVQFINMSGPEINVSLQTGQIDAGVTWEPYISQILSSGKMRVLMDGAGLKSGNEVIAVNKTLVEQSPEVVQTILAAFQRGHQFLQEHPNEAAKLIAEDVNLEPAQVEEAFNKIIFFPKIDEGTMSEFEATQKFLHELGVNRKTVDIAQFVDLQFQSATAP